MDHHWQASHHASSPNGSDGEDASTEAAATQEIAQLPSNVNPLPPAFDEHTQICPPQVPHTASFNRIIHGVMEGHYLPGEERASAVLDCAQNNTLGDESLNFCNWMYEQREAFVFSQENLPQEQTISAGSTNSPAPVYGYPSEEEYCVLGLSSQSLLGIDLIWEAERAMDQSGIQIDNSTPISNPDIADVLRYLEQNPSQRMLESVAAPSDMATAHGITTGEENENEGSTATPTAEARPHFISARAATVPEQALPEDFVLSTGESETDSLTDQSGESKQSSSNSIAEGRTEASTSIAMQQHHTLHSSASSLESPESDESDSRDGDDEVAWRSMRREVKRQVEEIKATLATEIDECLDEPPCHSERQEQFALSCHEEVMEQFENGKNRSTEAQDISSTNEAAMATISVSSRSSKPSQPESYNGNEEEKDDVVN